MKLVILLYLILLACFTKMSCTSKPIDNCTYCVNVLKCVFGHFGKSVKSKRQLGNKLVATCKRYSQYRSRCIRVVKSNLLLIFDNMQPEKYDPVQTCIELQECAPSSLASDTISTSDK
ncbi:Saposin B-type domain-containing protein [Caenorhabditis elegans]|uniref:Saposin B-type domain-containing protein n=1 Tax=Caenorhabditis elegans TaxID=6239 RepID=G2HJZ5_CAEEL|nr:Saposin B-type domain-containing protein [Caenorhabditis elegans]CCD31160.1 Saposin B-type domain-containing protein [Caenorhabditis elegans]|eukprot:NP_001257164.1 Uncharacterized protein CELE_Y71H9A.10 [Caenorhabditis elegans]